MVFLVMDGTSINVSLRNTDERSTQVAGGGTVPAPVTFDLQCTGCPGSLRGEDDRTRLAGRLDTILRTFLNRQRLEPASFKAPGHRGKELKGERGADCAPCPCRRTISRSTRRVGAAEKGNETGNDRSEPQTHTHVSSIGALEITHCDGELRFSCDEEFLFFPSKYSYIGGRVLRHPRCL